MDEGIDLAHEGAIRGQPGDVLDLFARRRVDAVLKPRYGGLTVGLARD